MQDINNSGWNWEDFFKEIDELLKADEFNEYVTNQAHNEDRNKT